MLSSYLRHPLLRNPLKWLRGVSKRHTTDLYLDNFYDTRNLGKNPFLVSLLDTRLDMSRTRFPIGNMVQTVVAGSPKTKSYEVIPVLEKPHKGQNPGVYVINNKEYINFLSRKRFSPIPLKYKHKSSSIIGAIKTPQDFSAEIEELYKNGIVQLLKELPKSDIEGNKDCEVVCLKPGNLESIVWEPNSSPIIYSSLVQKETILSYTEHSDLILLFLKFSAFVKV